MKPDLPLGVHFKANTPRSKNPKDNETDITAHLQSRDLHLRRGILDQKTLTRRKQETSCSVTDCDSSRPTLMTSDDVPRCYLPSYLSCIVSASPPSRLPLLAMGAIETRYTLPLHKHDAHDDQVVLKRDDIIYLHFPSRLTPRAKCRSPRGGKKENSQLPPLNEELFKKRKQE